MSDFSSSTTQIDFTAIVAATGPYFIMPRAIVRAGGSNEVLVPGCVLQADSNAHNLEPWGGTNSPLGILLEPITATSTAQVANVLVKGHVKPDHVHIYNANANIELTAANWYQMRACGLPSVSFKYRPIGAISGTLKDEDDTARAGITVTLKNASGDTIGTATTAESTGAYSFTGITTGTYYLNVPATSVYYATVSQPVVVAENATTTANIESLFKVGVIDGNLVDEDATALEGVVVTLKDSDGNTVATDTTDASGDFDFAAVTVGTYTLNTAATATYYALADSVTVTEDATTVANMEALFKVGSIAGVCSDDDEPANLLEGVSLICYLSGHSGDPEYGPVLSNADGEYEFPAVRVGTAWIVTASLAGHDTKTADPVTVATDTETELNLTLDVTT